PFNTSQDAGADQNSFRSDRFLNVLESRDRRLIQGLVIAAVNGAQNSVLADGGNQIALLPIHLGAENRTDLSQVPVMRVIGNRLFVPVEVAGPNVQSDDRVRITVVARAKTGGQVWRRIGHGDVKFALRDVEGHWSPHRAAAEFNSGGILPALRVGFI